MNMFFIIDSDSKAPVAQNHAIDSDMQDAGAVATVEHESSYSASAATDTSGSGSWISWPSVGLAICIALLLWKIINKLSKDAQTIRNRLAENERAINSALRTIEELDNEIKALNKEIKELTDKVNSIKNRKGMEASSPGIVEPLSRPVAQSAEFSVPSVKAASKVTVKYATLQSPNEQGVLRFSERSMVETPSSQKMFILEIDTLEGTGSYRINPAATSLILGDLQLFKDFVKPFTFSGNPANATIQDKVPGKIVRQGNYWVVENLLDISIN